MINDAWRTCPECLLLSTDLSAAKPIYQYSQYYQYSILYNPGYLHKPLYKSLLLLQLILSTLSKPEEPVTRDLKIAAAAEFHTKGHLIINEKIPFPNTLKC